ncbi:KOW [Ostreococcus tauri]|uniref:KOW n=1 Tax=Ostreococcus tauri TaxID=70448 RepID=A0A090MCL4_OSTTA|nr:KOW [Ostreococcus tauri]CEF99824.1 KOW [Ostreococcus tauri]|eukprot:XP_022840056.1 KOW [Ostreococcus tauri]
MKYSTAVTSSRRKTRKAHFTAPSSERRKLMSAALSAELKAQHGANAVPIRVNDEVRVTRGSFKNREGKVVQVYRKKWVIHIANITRDKVNGTQIQVGVDPSKCIITKLHMDKDRKALLARKGGASGSADEAMQTVS